MEQRLELRGGSLGQGAFAAVYRGFFDGLPVAVKVLLPQHANAAAAAPAARPDCPARLLRAEGELLLRAPHVCLVRCHAVLTLPPDFPGLGRGYAAPAPALVLELMEGGSLTSLLHKQLIAPWKPVYDTATAAEWAAQLAEALAHLHTLQPPVLHRDIKVENVMLQRVTMPAAGSGSNTATEDLLGDATPDRGQQGGGQQGGGATRVVAKLVDLGLHTAPALLDRCTEQPLFRVPAAPPPSATSPGTPQQQQQQQLPLGRATGTGTGGVLGGGGGGGPRRSALLWRSGSQELASTPAGAAASGAIAASPSGAAAATGSLSTGGPLKLRHRLSSPGGSPVGAAAAAAAAAAASKGGSISAHNQGRVTASGTPCRSVDTSAHNASGNDSAARRAPLFFTPVATGRAELVPVDVLAPCARQLTQALPLLPPTPAAPPAAVTAPADALSRVEERRQGGGDDGTGDDALEDGGLFDVAEEVQLAPPPRSDGAGAGGPLLLKPEDVAALFGGGATAATADAAGLAASTPVAAEAAALAGDAPVAAAAASVGFDFAFPHGSSLLAASNTTPTAAAGSGLPLKALPVAARAAAAVRCEPLSLRALHVPVHAEAADSPLLPFVAAGATAAAAAAGAAVSGTPSCSSPCGSATTLYQPWWQEGGGACTLASGPGGGTAASAASAQRHEQQAGVAQHACGVQVSGDSNTSSMCTTGATATIATATTTHTGLRDFSELNLVSLPAAGQLCNSTNNVSSAPCNGSSSIGSSPDDVAAAGVAAAGGSNINFSLMRVVAAGSSSCFNSSGGKQHLLRGGSSRRQQQPSPPVGVILEAPLEPCSSGSSSATAPQAEQQQRLQDYLTPTATTTVPLPPTALQRALQQQEANAAAAPPVPAAAMRMVSPFAPAAASAAAVEVCKEGQSRRQHHQAPQQQEVPRHSCPAGLLQSHRPTAAALYMQHAAAAEMALAGEGRAPRASEGGSPSGGGVLPRRRPYCLSEHCPPARGDGAPAVAAAEAAASRAVPEMTWTEATSSAADMSSAAAATAAVAAAAATAVAAAVGATGTAMDRSASCPAAPPAGTTAAAAHVSQPVAWCEEPSFRPRDGAPAQFAEAAAGHRRSSEARRQQAATQPQPSRVAAAVAAAALVLHDVDDRSVRLSTGRPLPEVTILMDDSPRRATAAAGAAAAAGGPAGDASRRHLQMLSAADYAALAAPLVPCVPPYERVWRLTGETGSCMTMSPEVYLDLPYNEKADVFSFGVLLYELFTRTLLAATHIGTKRPDLPRILHRCEDYALEVARGYRPARTPGVPDPVWALITQCWQHDPLRRPAMPAVAARLRALARELAAVADAAGGGEGSRHGSSVSRRFSSSLSGLGLGGGGGGGGGGFGRRSGFGGCVGGGGDGDDAGGRPAAAPAACTGCVIC
ncbi:hypothetical protein HYH02_009168 [Chlamydomonas schloesseri]|uniref:Protein kinase domain-containing protein n=1 Tax=Chlamydomonas schloesseri TaxID=2026947 RepID=A0A836B0P6_9CHLO|nr:hypothetical protein HYH02_009168 [Chlamydomonas schloesseri]|eukprot:KAG2444231.1 hypothetical protein HYH02_009168 [Chlamydomonas schloesseri]